MDSIQEYSWEKMRSGKRGDYTNQIKYFWSSANLPHNVCELFGWIVSDEILLCGKLILFFFRPTVQLKALIHNVKWWIHCVSGLGDGSLRIHTNKFLSPNSSTNNSQYNLTYRRMQKTKGRWRGGGGHKLTYSTYIPMNKSHDMLLLFLKAGHWMWLNTCPHWVSAPMIVWHLRGGDSDENMVLGRP